jgi:hypothetical protein
MRYELIYLALGAWGMGCVSPQVPISVRTAEQASADPQALERACKEKPPHDKFDLSSVICIDARVPDDVKQLRSDTERGDSSDESPQVTLQPNRTIIVRVLVGKQKVSSISLGGTGGQTIAEIIGSPSGAVAPLGSTSDAALGGRCAGAEMACAKFVSRTPGVARLRIMLQPVGAEPRGIELDLFGAKIGLRIGDLSPPAHDPKQLDFEYLIPRIYSGAIRLGLSTVWGAHDVAYTSAPRGGGAGGLVSELSSSRFTNELVVGYAPFPESFSQREGRDYVHPLTWDARHRFAPYFGLGVVSAAPSSEGGTKSAWLRSVYLGGEYEIFQGASIAAAFVIRRAERRADGVMVGELVPSGTALTDMKTQFGIGLVLNFTPDFFKVAATVGAK